MGSTLFSFVAGAAAGAGAAYLLDRQSGARRRSLITDKAGKLGRQAEGAGGSVVQQATAVTAKAKHAVAGDQAPPDDDVTLARKVETEIFRPADAPKGSVDVQVVGGVVELRGQVDDRAAIEALEKKARSVAGIRDVRNLLHLPGETPPNLAGTPGVGS